MAYNYTSLTAALAEACGVDQTDSDFVALEPTIIDQAEQRCYRELDLLATVVTVNGSMTANSRFWTLPTSSGHILVVDAINVFDASNVRHPLTKSSRNVVDFIWPSETAPSATSIPEIFARIDDTRVLVGPAPGSSLSAEVVATIRPAPLSATNPDTYLTDYLSDLFFAASMVAATGLLLKNYGAQADDPKQAISWETVYQSHFASANTEELRKKYVTAMSSPARA